VGPIGVEITSPDWWLSWPELAIYAASRDMLCRLRTVVAIVYYTLSNRDLQGKVTLILAVVTRASVVPGWMSQPIGSLAAPLFATPLSSMRIGGWKTQQLCLCATPIRHAVQLRRVRPSIARLPDMGAEEGRLSLPDLPTFFHGAETTCCLRGGRPVHYRPSQKAPPIDNIFALG